jgi:DNA-binding NtrC family response regulator
VRQSGGDIQIFSTPGEGTKVCLLLPRYDGLAPDSVEDSGFEPIETMPRLRIMLVEDDAGVRGLALESLSELGHETMAFENAEAALPVLEDAEIDLLMTDFQMPGMNGEELATRARKMRPELPILIFSAYRKEATQSENFEVLKKPYTLNQLSTAIVRALGGRRG